MNTEEALRFVEDELENEDVLQADIALVPPEDGSDTDEDNTDEDLGGDFIKVGKIFLQTTNKFIFMQCDRFEPTGSYMTHLK
uniref:Uncharacterized protein n=1 Tax=Acrobeloides nanus TaxID=290746 RepID=A0A914DHE7_9BILA